MQFADIAKWLLYSQWVQKKEEVFSNNYLKKKGRGGWNRQWKQAKNVKGGGKINDAGVVRSLG